MLKEITARLVERGEDARFRELLQAHHYLGALRKIGQTLWYVATCRGDWVALLTFSAAALKLAARDQWIGWSYRQQYARLPLLANNTRFCVLPPFRRPNVASRTLALCEHRVSRDWSEIYGHPIMLLETFVDSRHRGTLYLAANWTYIGDTRGFRRIPGGYSATVQEPKKIFVRPLHPQARARLCQVSFDEATEGKKRVLKMDHLRALPEIFRDIADPRRAAGRRYPLHSVLAIAAGAYLCGVRGYQAMGRWAAELPQTTRQNLRCRCERNDYQVPSEAVIRDVLQRVSRRDLEDALRAWNERFAISDASLTLHAHALCMQDGRVASI
jgi:Domain of unknown function (DUF4338)/DDE_Tnp_1-associated